MTGIVLSLVLIVGIAVGIVWPILQRQRTAPAQTEATASPSLLQEPRQIRQVEQLCPHCSTMNGPSRKTCRECASALPVQSFSGLLDGADKPETIRELTQAGLLLAGMIAVMLVSNWLPMPGKIAIIVGTLALLSFRFYKQVSGD